MVANVPNDVWSFDFKGWFRRGNGGRCDHLTVSDVFSRVALVCQAMFRPKLEDVRRRLESAFWSFGLPQQGALYGFRIECNEKRPQEVLGMKVPSASGT